MISKEVAREKNKNKSTTKKLFYQQQRNYSIYNS